MIRSGDARYRLALLRGLLGCLLLVGAGRPAPADRIYLDGGGVIETGAWHYDGDTLVYENAVGTVGLPRSIVLKIEPSAGPPAGTEADAAPSAPDGAPAGAEFVPADLAIQLRKARQALESRDYETAAALYWDAMVTADAELQNPRIGYAMSQIALGQDALAIGVVLDGLAHDPRQPALLELLGDLRDRQEQVRDALRSWREAFRHAPSDRVREKILKAERELDAGRNYSFTTTANFNLRYDGQVDEALSLAVSDYLEQQYGHLADAFRHAPRQPITVLLYPTRKFRSVTQTPDTVGGIYDGKIRVPLGGLRRLNTEARAVLRHELTHAVVHSKTRGQCPRWLHEGLAQRSEGRTLARAEREAVAAALQGIEPADWESGGFSYPAALSLTAYLETRNGFGRMVELLELLGEGRSIDAALDRIYGASHRELCREWFASLTEETDR